MMMATVMVVAKYRCNTTTRPTCYYICIKKKENCGRSAVPERAEERDAERRAQNAAAIRESKMNRRNSFYSYYVYKSFASFANASSFALSAPHISFTITPLEYSWNVGIALIPQAAATSSNSSTSTLTNSTSGNLVASSSKYGPIALHGPHHVAVKSTRSCCFWRRRFQREREILLLQRSIIIKDPTVGEKSNFKNGRSRRARLYPLATPKNDTTRSSSLRSEKKNEKREGFVPVCSLSSTR